MGPHNHVCAFFQNREEEYKLLLPFIAEGFERGERAFHIVDPSLRTDHLHRLDRAGIPVEDADEPQQLESQRLAGGLPAARRVHAERHAGARR